MKNEKITNCIINHIEGLRFPASGDGKPVIVRHPFVFKIDQ